MVTKNNLKYSNNLEDSIDYLNECTTSWNLEATVGDVCLYNYHDGVDWKTHYAISINGVVKSLLKDVSYNEAYNAFKVVVDCLK